MSEVRVFTKPNCVWCVRTKNMLEEEGIPFEEIDVSEDRGAYDLITLAWGFRQVPVVDTGEDRWAGHRPGRIKGIA